MCLVASMPTAVLIILSESTLAARCLRAGFRDLEPALEQLGEEFFTGDRIVARSGAVGRGREMEPHTRFCILPSWSCEVES